MTWRISESNPVTEQYCIYWNPSDYPKRFVVHREAFIRTLNPNVEVYDIQIAESEGGWRYAAHTRDSKGRVNTIIGIVPEGGSE